MLFALALLTEYMTRKPMAGAAIAQMRAYMQAEQTIRHTEQDLAAVEAAERGRRSVEEAGTR